MHPNQYGPFANVVTVACALVAVFETLILKMLGKRWACLASDTPPLLVAAGARILTVALIAVTYLIIDVSNYWWFGVAAVVSGVLGYLSVSHFNHLRILHVAPIPVVGPNGEQLQDRRGTPLVKNVVIGLESQLLPQAASDLNVARGGGPISLRKFMSGYGSPVNDPRALWDEKLLANTANKLVVSLMRVGLFAVMTVFLAAIVVDVAMTGAR